MKTALVTGAGGALGTGITKCLVADGWRVIAADFRPHMAQAMAKEVGPDKVEPVGLDVRDRDAVAKTVAAIVDEHGSIDGLVNCAGGTGGVGVKNMPFMETTAAIRETIMGANLYGVLTCCHVALPHMIKAGQGAIVNIASAAGIPGGPSVWARRRNAAVYSAVKHGVIVFTRSLALEVGPHGIRVNTIAPGRAVSSHQSLESIAKIQAEEEARQPGSSRQSPLGRMLQAEDIGDAATFLLSERASHITGCLYDLSGGLRVY